jgi:hypothetical protein
MKTYKLKKKLLLTILDQYSSNDYIFHPTDPITIVANDTTIYLKDQDGKLWESSSTLSIIEEAINNDILEEI